MAVEWKSVHNGDTPKPSRSVVIFNGDEHLLASIVEDKSELVWAVKGGDFPNAIDLDAFPLWFDFPDPPLEMIKAMERPAYLVDFFQSETNKHVGRRILSNIDGVTPTEVVVGNVINGLSRLEFIELLKYFPEVTLEVALDARGTLRAAVTAIVVSMAYEYLGTKHH